MSGMFWDNTMSINAVCLFVEAIDAVRRNMDTSHREDFVKEIFLVLQRNVNSKARPTQCLPHTTGFPEHSSIMAIFMD